MSAPAKILFLDIDGVLNPFKARSLSELAGEWKTVRIANQVEVWHSYYCSPSVGAWLRSLTEHGVTIVWATTWIDDRSALRFYARYLGLPTNLPRISYRPHLDFTGPDECGKQPGVEAWLAENGVTPSEAKIVWVDDDLGTGDRSYAAPLGIVTIAPDPALGLSDSAVRAQIEQGFGFGEITAMTLTRSVAPDRHFRG